MAVRMSYIFVGALAVIAIIALYASIGFYVDRSESEACIQSQEILEEGIPNSLSDQTNFLLAKFGEEEINTPSKNLIKEKIELLRAEKITEKEDLIDLTTLEINYFLFSGYLQKSNCNLYKNIARINFARSAIFFADSLKTVDIADFESEIQETDDNYQTVLHSAVPQKCDYVPENMFLSVIEEEYCGALHEQSFLLAKELKETLDDVEDQPSKVYRAILINCLGECTNRDACLDNCLNEKIA